MKVRSIFSSVAVCSVVLSSCVCGNKTASNVAPAVVETVTDSLVINDDTGNYKCTFEYPKDTTLALNLAIGEFINETLGGNYMGDCSKIKTLLKNDFDSTTVGLQEEFRKYEEGIEGMSYSYVTSFKVYAQTPAYITYLCEISQYSGGAHGSYSRMGVTFRKSDSRRIGWEVFKNINDPKFQGFIKEGLKKEWNLKTDKELKECLFSGDYFIRLPDCSPLFTEKGVEFVYNQYEIAAYAMGTPSFTVPYYDLRDNLMSTAKKLLL